MLPKPVTFHGDSLDRLRDFPTDVRQQAGQELYRVQIGRDPSDWKPMQTIGAGVREIRLRDARGAFRVVYVCDVCRRCSCPARLPEEVAEDSTT
jgi:phage-related protein